MVEVRVGRGAQRRTGIRGLGISLRHTTPIRWVRRRYRRRKVRMVTILHLHPRRSCILHRTQELRAPISTIHVLEGDLEEVCKGEEGGRIKINRRCRGKQSLVLGKLDRGREGLEWKLVLTKSTNRRMM